MSQSLAIAGQFSPSQLVGGVASYFQNLVRGLEQVVASNERFRNLQVTVFHGPHGVPYRSPRFAHQLMSHRLGRFSADSWYGLWESGAFDATLFPNYFRPPIVRSRRSVAVFHDLLERHMPELATWRRRAWLDRARKHALRRCDRVITISHAVRDDVLRWYGRQWESKVRAIWNPIAFERLNGHGRQTATGGRPYVLAVAVDRPSKNLYTLIRSFASLRGRFPDHCLVLVGELRSRRPKSRIHSPDVAASMPPTVDLVRELELDDRVIITGFVTDEELGALYRGADVYVMPSVFEGFGMPPIEALAMGTPTLVSDIPVLREITLGRAAYLHDPRNVDAVSDDLAQVLANPAAARPSQETVAQVRNAFAPSTIAAQYLEAIFDD